MYSILLHTTPHTLFCVLCYHIIMLSVNWYMQQLSYKCLLVHTSADIKELKVNFIRQKSSSHNNNYDEL